MKPQVFESLFLASEVAKYANDALYIAQYNYGNRHKFTIAFERGQIDTEDSYLVAVFKVSASLKSSIPVMQVNKEGQLINLIKSI
jgi:hypothetical protein